MGGLLVDGRWHHRGRRVVYLAEHPALALLETFVHLEIDPEDFPKDYTLICVDVSNSVTIEELSEEELDTRAPAWRHMPAITRVMTSSWFEEKRSALLRIPSVVVPNAANYLLNPLHPDASLVKIDWTKQALYDGRLFGPQASL
jgi:RES domain-containing protein